MCMEWWVAVFCILIITSTLEHVDSVSSHGRLWGKVVKWSTHVPRMK